ncbi:MAG: hypothetical protein IM638_07730 [Bacteroidetes bacterium]|nr:hypothetical protein [Bacteroidota bacterium]
MDSVYQNFFRGCYQRTGGFVPSGVLGVTVFPGDFFQLRNGEFILLGNIFKAGLVLREDVDFGYAIGQNPVMWNFSEGVSKSYSGRGSGHHPVDGNFQFSRQIISFADAGSYLFKSGLPESVKMLNWSELQNALIIKLTQTVYSFRQLYVVTETVAAADWTLAISGAHKGELEIATDVENFGLTEIFGMEQSYTVQTKGIEYYNRETGKIPSFFRAKKLVVQDEPLDVFIGELIMQMTDRHSWAADYFDFQFTPSNRGNAPVPMQAQASLLDMMQANQLNPNTALRYFKWADFSLDDLAKLFVRHE